MSRAGSEAPHFGVGIPSNAISHDRLSAIIGGSGLTDNCEDVGSNHARDVTCATSTANSVDDGDAADPREQQTSPAASPSLQGPCSPLLGMPKGVTRADHPLKECSCRASCLAF